MGLVIGVLAVFYLIGFGILGYGVRAAWRSTQARSWPTTPGTLTQLELEPSASGDPDPTWRVAVAYRYEVDGKPYTGSRIAYGYLESGDRAMHEQLHARLAGARTIDVRYDPNDPSASALSYGVHASVRAMLGFGAMWLSFVLTLTLTWWLTNGADRVLIDGLSVR